uniref:NADH-ubiquinone oxidoreductase chain 4L n=1 Tax=Falcidens halanychi TaxID=370642 RepID=A0A343X882_9MOLL|nr:NADH dehydrogenase subunit 4L [Falcidens halanychi]AWH02141.1 NADH dehydrogenase subunit 4L [Falcidens halanychi]
MIEYLVVVGFFMMVVSLVALGIQNNHLLNCLLSLEMLLLSMVFIVFLALSVKMLDFLFPLVLLTFGACEASMGLALLVVILRSQGNDFMLSSMYKC